MLEIPSTLQAKLDGGATTTCRCWRIDRRDGVALGFTDHDNDLEFDGVTFSAASGLESSAIEASLGMSVDSHSISGALVSDAITEDDIRRGRYRNAKVTQWVVDWTDVDDRVMVFYGTIGEITFGDHTFEAEIVGLLDQLNAPTGRAYLRTCSAKLGDKECGVDLDAPAFVEASTVLEVESATSIIVSFTGDHESHWFDHGKMSWKTGLNAGNISAIRVTEKVTAGIRVYLWSEPDGDASVGDTLDLYAGCDKRAETCRTKFSNILNFRGFPHMPGEDWMINYPTSGGKHDGGSLFRS